MSDSQSRDVTIMAFTLDYERYLVDVRGLASNSCKLHLHVVRGLLNVYFPSGDIHWRDLRFSQMAEFLTKEFHRLPNHWTQKAWLIVLRRLVRYLESEGHIPNGWEDALPKRINWRRASLPRYLSPEQMRALWDACRNKTHRHVRDRALLLVFTGLGLRTEEVAGLTLKDIDWEKGNLLVRSTKTRRERTLPLAQDVGDGLIEHIRGRAAELNADLRTETTSLYRTAQPRSYPELHGFPFRACGTAACPSTFTSPHHCHGHGESRREL
jgi:integrase/recombinase XerD